MSHRTLPKCLERVVFALLEDLNTPRALSARLLIEHGEWDQFLDLKVDPAHYTNPWDFFRDACVTDLLRKCQNLPGSTPTSRALKAVGSFYESEKACKVTNDRFSLHIFNGPFEAPNDVRVADLLQRVKKEVALILRSLPLKIEGRHGKGATFSDRGQRTTVPDKMSTQPTATRGALSLIPFWEDTAWCRALCEEMPNRSSPKVVRGNRFETVPKDALKDRGICIEPSLNIFLQLGLGGVIRRRLMDAGVDLDKGQLIHRQVACAASKTGLYSTIDLSNASDTVAKELVRFLLPELWYEALESLRSPFTIIEGKTTLLEKFSSMGNGFTFELETLIFSSLAIVATRASGIEPVLGSNIWVYGDDIIVPTCASRNLLAILRYCGFTPNRKKTFTDGVFRESCGGDYFLGVNVRPHLIEEYPNEASAWISLANGFRRVAAEHFGSDTYLGPFQRAWFRTLDNLPSHIRRLRGPVSLGDIVIHDHSDWCVKYTDQQRMIRGYVAIGESLPLARWGPGTQLASALYGVPSTGPIPRKSGKVTVSGYHIKWINLP